MADINSSGRNIAGGKTEKKKPGFDVFVQELKENIIRKAYLFCGNEEYLKSHYLKTLTGKLVRDEMRQMDEFMHEGKIEMGRIREICATPSFGGGKRSVILINTGFFSKSGTSEGELAQILDEIDEGTCLVFVEDEVDKRLKNTLAIDKKGLVVEFARLSENDLAKWVMKIASSYGKTIDIHTAFNIVSRCEPDMNSILNETVKLVSYTADRNEITESDVEKACSKTLKSIIFDLLDALSAKDMSGALKILDDLIAMREPAQLILHMMAKHFRQILQIKLLMDEGTPRGNCASAMGIHPFTVEKLLKFSSRFDKDKLRTIIYDCLEYDLAIKTGNIGDRLAAELLIASSCA